MGRSWALSTGCLVLVVVTACGGTPSAAPTASPEAVSAGSGRSVEPQSPAPEGMAPHDPAVAHAAFLTAIDEILLGTEHEGLVDAEPAAFVETAELLCARLDDGQDADDLLTLYLEALGSARGATVSADAQLAGALFGAGVQVYCPRHAAVVPPVQETDA